MERCPDCNYALSLHFQTGTGPRQGQYRGCPPRLSAAMGHAQAHPRVSFRMITQRGDRYDASQVDRKGHTLVTWADYQDDEGNALFWDLDTGDQWMGDLNGMKLRTRRLNPDETQDARERLQRDIGGPVQVVTQIRMRREQLS